MQYVFTTQKKISFEEGLIFYTSVLCMCAANNSWIMAKFLHKVHGMNDLDALRLVHLLCKAPSLRNYKIINVTLWICGLYFFCVYNLK